MEIANCLDVHDLIDSSDFDDLQEAYNKLYREFKKYAKKSIRLEAKLKESNKLVEKYKDIVEKSLEKLNESEHVKEDLGVNLEDTNKFVDEIKIENQSLKVKVKGLEEDLVESKAKLENVSNPKHVVEPEYESTPIKLKDVKVYVPPFKRNHNEEKANFSRKYKGKRAVNEFNVK